MSYEFPNQYPQTFIPEPPEKKKHAEAGIAAFVVSLMNCGCLVLTFGVPVAMAINETETSNGINLLIGLAIFAVLGFGLLGLLLGLIGMFQPKRKRVFSIISLLVSFVLAIISLVFIIPGIIKTAG